MAGLSEQITGLLSAPLLYFHLDEVKSVATLSITSAAFLQYGFDVALRRKTAKHQTHASPLIVDDLINMCERKQLFP